MDGDGGDGMEGNDGGRGKYDTVDFTRVSDDASCQVCLPFLHRGDAQPGVAWWNQFGGDVEELQIFAIRILSQTCSATGCERNWSTFEHIHSAKRNRLEHQRLDDLVFVHYNLKFRERDLLRKSSTTSDPLSIDHLDVMMDWVAEEEDVIFTLEDIGWENLEAPTAVVGAEDDDDDDDDDDFLMPLEEDVPTGGPGGDDGGGDDDDDDEEDIEYDHPGYDD
ncbi:uncharacterized protein LOC143853148 [Tasmannia lanceolata]|uniref:uncharacterized protein LOC143853148 n=1 Tax=Tasmannia lanceolata TaxID=3420 RepID=UPI004062BD90